MEWISNLKRIMDKSGYTPEQVARATNIPQAIITKILSGYRELAEKDKLRIEPFIQKFERARA